MGIWQHTHTVTTTEVSPDLGELAEILDKKLSLDDADYSECPPEYLDKLKNILDEFEIKKIAFEKPDAAITTKSITISDSVDNIAVAVNPKSIQLLSMVDYVIKNEFSNIDTKKLMDRYKSEKK